MAVPGDVLPRAFLLVFAFLQSSDGSVQRLPLFREVKKQLKACNINFKTFFSSQ